MTMTNTEFRAIRHRLGLTQAQLATRLDYKTLSISAFERQSQPRPIPLTLGLLMVAFDWGFRPNGWDDHEPAADAGTGGKGTGDRRGHAEGDAQGRRDPVHQHRPRSKARDAALRSR